MFLDLYLEVDREPPQVRDGGIVLFSVVRDFSYTGFSVKVDIVANFYSCFRLLQTIFPLF